MYQGAGRSNIWSLRMAVSVFSMVNPASRASGANPATPRGNNLNGPDAIILLRSGSPLVTEPQTRHTPLARRDLRLAITDRSSPYSNSAPSLETTIIASGPSELANSRNFSGSFQS